VGRLSQQLSFVGFNVVVGAIVFAPPQFNPAHHPSAVITGGIEPPVMKLNLLNRQEKS
jgi:hypothetical protein